VSKPAAANRRIEGLQISWTTVTYRSVLLFILVVACIAAVATYWVLPAASQTAVRVSRETLAGLFQKISRTSGSSGNAAVSRATTGQQAHFTNLDGTVRVKRKDGNNWIAAGYSTPLEKGDVVQTGAEGMAKVIFADGTNYTVKPDSLIVVEENSTNSFSQTKVAVQVTTGTVDLATGTFSQGSKSQVIVAGATADLSPETAASVLNDDNRDQHELVLKRGAAEVTRNGEKLQLAKYEKVSFLAASAQMTREKEIIPPTLTAPANLLPLVANPDGPVEFSWTPVDDARGYHIRLSRNPFFNSLLIDRRVETAATRIPGLEEGNYYWSVRSLDAKGRESVESERDKFTIIPQVHDTSLALSVDQFTQHGHVLEVRGRTEPSARVSINGQEVPVIDSDGGFHFFTSPLPNGNNLITITAQNSRGGITTQSKTIVIQ